ncbi:MAG: transcriptional regulator [Azospirillum brasilense]|nr:MAG: transcriptional regulator [Azospirillum brasilense]
MDSIADMLAPDAVLLHLKASTLDDALQQISAHAAEVTGLASPLILAALRERTAQGVGMGHGVALPHARLDGLRRVAAFFARPLAPIPSPDGGEPIRLIFILLAPQTAHAAHLKALAQVARVLRMPESRMALEQAPDKNTAYALLVAA